MSVLKKTYIAGIAEDDKEIMTEYKLKIKEGRSLRDSRDSACLV